MNLHFRVLATIIICIISAGSQAATYALESPSETINTCFPPGVTARLGSAVFIKWATKNPESHHKFVNFGVIKSLNEAFQCPASPKPKP